MTSVELIISVLRREMEASYRKHCDALAKYHATEAGKKAWDEAHGQDDGIGCFSVNPYRTVDAEKSLDGARDSFESMKKAYEFAVDTFLSLDSPHGD